MKVIHRSSVYDGEDFEGCPNCGVIGAPYAVLTLECGKVKVCCPEKRPGQPFPTVSLVARPSIELHVPF